MDQYHSPDSADTHTDSIPSSPIGSWVIYRLQRIVVPVPVVVQPRLLIMLLPLAAEFWQLVQVMQVLFIQLDLPHSSYSPLHAMFPIRIHQRQHLFTM